MPVNNKPLIRSAAIDQNAAQQSAVDALVDAMLTSSPETLSAFADSVTRAQDHTGGFGDRATSVLNHAAMAGALRKGGLPEPLMERLSASLQASWIHLTDAMVPDVLAPLPARVLKTVDPLTAAFAGANNEGGLLRALGHYNANTAPQAEKSAADRLVASLTKAIAGPVPYLGAAAVAVGAPVAASFGASYVLASFFESFYHDNVAHADPETVKARREGNFIRRGFADSFEGHNYHHGMANKNYNVENETPEKKALRRSQLAKKGREDIADDDFGVTLDNPGFLKYLAGMLPAYAPAFGAAVALGAGLPVLAAVGVPMLFVPAASKWMHRYMHLPKKEVKEKLPEFLHALVHTEQWDRMVLRHFVHHERAKAGVNFNILPGAIGDKLRGALAEATPEEIAEARALGLID
jgi:hypothetical protein